MMRGGQGWIGRGRPQETVPKRRGREAPGAGRFACAGTSWPLGGERVWRTTTSIRWLCPPPPSARPERGLIAPLTTSLWSTMSPSSSSRSRHVVLGLVFSFVSSLVSVHAQAISSTMPVPPLQWINLSKLLSGPAAPPLKDATIGYDDTNGVLMIFGGESQQGFPTAQTYMCACPPFPLPEFGLRPHRSKYRPPQSPVDNCYDALWFDQFTIH